MLRRVMILLATFSLALSGLLVGSSGSAVQAKPANGMLYLVQAVPERIVSVTVDGKVVEDAAMTGDVVGPVRLAPGKHEVVLTSDAWSLRSTVKISSGEAEDVVLHSPASRTGDPVISQYAIPTQPIGPGKARVVLAHTATAPPADVRVDGRTVFSNIANGEFAEADVPAGGHQVALLPIGTDRGAFLGPLKLSLPNDTVTMVYAVGWPRDGSMRIVSHSAGLSSDGSVTPTEINTGSAAGSAREMVVSPFGTR